MQPRTWLVGALVVSMLGMAQPIIIIDPFLTGTLIAAGGAAALLGAAAIGAGAVGAGVVGAGAAVGAAKLGAVGAGALGAATVGAVGAGALGAAAVGAGTVGLAKVGLAATAHNGFSAGVRSSLNNQHSGSYSVSYSSRRHRRDINSISAAQEILLRDAYSLDQEKPCGLRLVCEMATKGADELEREELLILDLLHRSHSPDSMLVPYEEALDIGRTSASAAACAEVFQRCEYDRFQIMQLLRQNFAA
ncbi:uncharacterized protein LOC135103860 [Scylla paramamosain]|uniref:uncharacterized protein LOC135103860 n=1 Tax=Scylla paramamosain TaxID=85552 RepID=UPI0030834FB3